MLNKVYLGIFVILLFNGCALRKGAKSCGILNVDGISNSSNALEINRKNYVNPYQMKIKPIVGSRQDDAKVVVDMGKVLKVWISPYKSSGTMIASHDLYTWVEKPRFIPGESIDYIKKADGMMSSAKRLPFVFNEHELAKEGDLTSEDVKDYVNSVYKTQNNNQVEENNKKSSKYDSTINRYLQNKRK